MIQHVFDIRFVQGHGGLALATVSALLAFKNFCLLSHYFAVNEPESPDTIGFMEVLARNHQQER